MFLKKLYLDNFRNYKDLRLEFPPEGAFFTGANGSGKTNILESIHMLCTGSSQRNARKQELINFESLSATIEGEFILQAGEEQKVKYGHIVFNRDKFVELSVNGRKLASFSEWFGTQAIVSFAPNDIQIVEGNPSQRRRFLDIFISTLDKDYLIALIGYRKNLSLRNALFKTAFDTILCEIYEEKMAEYGSVIVQKRRESIGELSPVCAQMYREISAYADTISVVYAPSIGHENSRKKTWKEVFLTMLAERRVKDREMGFSSCGPHRDELHFFINDKPAAVFASQGQCRSLVLSLKISTIACIEKQARDPMIVLFDDAVSELDPGRAARVFAIVENRGQLFIASPSKTASLRKTLPYYTVADGRAACG